MSEYKRLVNDVSVERVASMDYQMYGSGNTKKCKCPNCGKEKHFHISEGKNIGKCFSCGFFASNSVQYYSKTRNIPWTESVSELSKIF